MFWADQLARKIVSRDSFHYLDKPVPKLKQFRVKTSASLSGVLHIGRLSDTIRGDSVFKALEDAGVKAELIWVAENMDPLRKVPEGVPASYKEHIGMPVTDVPDPWGCHASYAEHFTAVYFEVVDDFVSTPMKKYSMREEYKKGNL
ncbi:lysine--tRNA ligase, partial [Candidatus Woesearchaeota archaeon CG_4_10_14_0_8_um_filter_47_5]